MCRILSISCYFKVKPITDEFDKILNGNQFEIPEMIPDHKVILEEALIVLRQKKFIFSKTLENGCQ
jgi:hypothetical protein